MFEIMRVILVGNQLGKVRQFADILAVWRYAINLSLYSGFARRQAI